MKATGQGRDVDYIIRWYYVQSEEGRKGIMHGSGANWSHGTPLDLDVWRSIRFEEAAFEAGGLTIVDARGQLPNGKWWRYLGTFCESASYSDMDEATAKILDKFLDGVCINPVRR